MGEFNEIMRNAKGSVRRVRGYDPHKKQKNIIKLVICLVIFFSIVISLYFRKEIKNQLKLSSTTPTKHYLEIEKNYVQKRIDEYSNLVKIYNDRLEKQGNNRELKARMEVKQEFIDAFFVPKRIDTYGATSAEFNIGTASDENGKSLEVLAKINDAELIKGSFYEDKQTNKKYFQIPKISDKFVEMDNSTAAAPGIGTISLNSSGTLNNSFVNAILFGEKPTDYTESLKKLFDIYFKFVEESDSVQRTSESLEINGLSNEYNKFTFDMDGGQVCDLAVKILEEAKNDENMSELVLKFVDQVYACVDVDASEETLFDAEPEPTDNAGKIDRYITKFKDVKEKAKVYGKTISVYAYADISDKALGHDFVFQKTSEKIMELKSIMAIKNGRFAADVLYMKDDVNRISIKAYGPSNFTATTATAEFAYGDGKSIIKANINGCDTLKLKEGVFEGKITFASDDLYRNGKMVADVSLDVDNLVFNSNFYQNGVTTGYLNLSAGITEVPLNTKPKANDKVINMKDTKAMSKYAEDFNIKKFIKRFARDAKLDLDFEDLKVKYPIISMFE